MLIGDNVISAMSTGKYGDKLQANDIAVNKMMKNSKLVYDTTARLDNETVNVIDAATREFGAYLSNTNLRIA